MINNYMCEQCDKAAVCKIMDILAKFSDDAKKPLGVDIFYGFVFEFCTRRRVCGGNARR